MDIKKLNEQFQSYISEATIDNFRHIDFENIGCGFKVEHASTIDNKAALALDGYSNNTSTSNVFVSDDILYQGSPEEREALNDKVVALRGEVEKELLEAAKEFDNKVNEIMNKYGFKK